MCLNTAAKLWTNSWLETNEMHAVTLRFRREHQGIMCCSSCLYLKVDFNSEQNNVILPVVPGTGFFLLNLSSLSLACPANLLSCGSFKLWRGVLVGYGYAKEIIKPLVKF